MRETASQAREAPASAAPRRSDEAQIAPPGAAGQPDLAALPPHATAQQIRRSALLRVQRQRGNAAALRHAAAGHAGGPVAPPIMRFGSAEHRDLGNAASSGATLDIDLGDGTRLTYGEMVALAGDYFGSIDEIRALAATAPGQAELRWTRWWALSTGAEPAVDEAVKQRVRDRYYRLAANNVSHFSAGGTAGTSFEQAHMGALSKAFFAGAGGQDSRWQEAMAEEAFAQHYLTDMFSAGHVRTPRQELREWYQQNYADSIDRFVNYVAGRMTRSLDARGDIPWYWPNSTVQERIAARINALGGSAMASFSLGDIVSLAYHDYDNAHGLGVVSELDPSGVAAPGGYRWRAMGDGHLGESPITYQMSVAAMEAALNDLHVAREAGARMANGACVPEDQIQLEMQTQIEAMRPFSAMGYIPQEDTSAGNVAMQWQWGSLNPELREAIDHAVKHDIVSALRAKTGDVPETLRYNRRGGEDASGAVVLHVRDVFTEAVDHLASEGIGAIEAAVSTPAAPPAPDAGATMDAGPMDATAPPDAGPPVDAGAPVPAGVALPDDERDGGAP